MTRFFAIAAVLSVAAASNAADLFGTVELIEANAATANPANGQPFPIDLYHVFVDNTGNGAATSLEFTFPGAFVDNFAGNFSDTFALPQVFGNDIADTFLVHPPGSVLVGKEDVTDNIVDLAYTLSGDTELVAADADRTLVAVLSVLPGTELDVPSFFGRAAIDGGFENISFIPEPSTAILAGLALAGFAARRNG